MVKMRWPGAFVAVALAMALFVACGDDDSGSKATPTSTATSAGSSTAGASATASAKDEAALKGMLLTTADYPSGWTSEPADESGESPLDRCDDGSSAKGRTARVQGDDWGDPAGEQSFQQSVVAYVDQAAITASLKATEAALSCAVDLINKGELDDGDFEYRNAKSAPIQVPAMGDEARGFRLSFHVRVADSGEEADGYLDIVYVRKGRVGTSMQGTGIGQPVDNNTLIQLARKAADKLKQP